MPKEMFPIKKTGDGLAASHVNDLGRVLTNLSGGNQGSGLQGTSGWITGVAGRIGPFQRLAKIRGDSSTSGVYTIRFRYWSESDSLWKDEDEDEEVDARCFSQDATDPQRSPKLVYGDFLSVRYDPQRGLWVPDQFLFSNSRWAWISAAIAARNGPAESSGTGKLVKETLNGAGTASTWTYLKDYSGNDVTVSIFNGFPDEIPADLHVRIGWNNDGQYEIKGVPCSADAELPA